MTGLLSISDPRWLVRAESLVFDALSGELDTARDGLDKGRDSDPPVPPPRLALA